MTVWETVRALASAVLDRILRRRPRALDLSVAQQPNGRTTEENTTSDGAIDDETRTTSAASESTSCKEQLGDNADRTDTTSISADAGSTLCDRRSTDPGGASRPELASVDPPPDCEVHESSATEHETIQLGTVERSLAPDALPAMETPSEVASAQPQAPTKNANPSATMDPLAVGETEPSHFIDTRNILAAGGGTPVVGADAEWGWEDTKMPLASRGGSLSAIEEEETPSAGADALTSADPRINPVPISASDAHESPREGTAPRVETGTPDSESAPRPLIGLEIAADATQPIASQVDAGPAPNTSSLVTRGAHGGIRADPQASISTEGPSNAAEMASPSNEVEMLATAQLKTPNAGPGREEATDTDAGAQPHQLELETRRSIEAETPGQRLQVTEVEARLSAVSPLNKRGAERLRPPKRTARQARLYRPVPRMPPVWGAGTTSATGIPRTRSLRVELRLRQQTGGFYQATLVPRREAGLPEQLIVHNGDTLMSLVALQDEWYQDVSLPRLGQSMRDGTMWQATIGNESISWAMSGREVFVLMQHRQLSGFVSAPLMVLGERHVVLFTQERARDVEQAIRATGAAVSSKLDTRDGLPDGWCGFRDVVPNVPVQASSDGSILDALCPVPDIEIAIEDGIPIGRTTWLEGFPPAIRLHGDSERAGPVQIDGVQAVFDPQRRSYSVDGWDRLGQHLVWCAGKSASYSIAPGDEVWRPWEVHRWSLGDAVAPDLLGRPAICGALVLSPRIASSDMPLSADRVVVVPSSNPILIGSAPGQIYSCGVRRDVRALNCTAFPTFDPIWALPSDVLHSKKQTARILLVGDLIEPHEDRLSARSDNAAGWCTQILAACKKGLRIDPDSPEVARLWHQYKRHARLLWRRAR